MFKNKPLLCKQTIAADKLLFSNIKKFNSERNLFFSNIYNDIENEHNDQQFNVNNKYDRTISSKSGFLKKFKSLKDLYHYGSSSSNSDPDVHIELTLTKFDDFERNYLFLNGKKDLVKKLRKNFENQNDNELNESDCIINSTTEPIFENNNKNNFFKYNSKRLSFNEKQNNEFLSRNAPERKSFYQTINYVQSRRSNNETDVENVNPKQMNNFINAQTKYKVNPQKCLKPHDDKIENKTPLSGKNGLVRKCSDSDLNLLKKELNCLINLKWKSIDKLSRIQTKVCVIIFFSGQNM